MIHVQRFLNNNNNKYPMQFSETQHRFAQANGGSTNIAGVHALCALLLPYKHC